MDQKIEDYLTTNSFPMRALTSVARATRKQNYVVKNNLAYTEDNVLVHNIFLYYLPKECTEEDVRCYFTQFGEVVRVRVMPGKQTSRSPEGKVGFVNYRDALSACKALIENNHRIQECRVGVSAGDSWNQPDADKVLGRTGKYHGHSDEKNEQQDAPNTSSEPPSNALTVLSLNDDCLEMICGLMDLRDQVNFARVCPRFNDVFKMFCKRKYKAFDLNKSFDLLKMSSMTLWEIRDYFRFSGEYIEEVAIINSKEINRKRIIEFIRLFCKNLKRITLNYIELQPDALHKLLRSVPKLVELRLFCCYNMNDTTVKSLLHLKNLDALIIHENHVVTGKFLSASTQLKKLSLYGCQNVQTKHLIQICKAMKHLKSLDVRGCRRLTSDFFETMADHCLELEVLKMPCPTFSFDCVARLPCLKHLELKSSLLHNDKLNKTVLAGLGAHKADQLESLNIFASLTVDHFTAISELKQLKIFYCDSSMPIGDDALRKLSKLELLEELVIKAAADITNGALLRLLQNCTRLHLLNIECCKEISTKFIAETIDMLKSRRDESKKPFTIFARGTSIDELALAESIAKLLNSKNITVKKYPRNRNWMVKNQLAYTEDDVLVHNIYVYNLPKKCTEEDVRCYFTTFGEVFSVQMKWTALNIGFVNFKDACSAYKALVHSKHQMRGSRIVVEAGDSWKQPDADKLLGRKYHGRSNEQDASNPTSEPPSNALTLLSLNDDCLEMICGVLELRDQVNFARVCPRFNDVFKMICKRKYKAIDLNKSSSMTLWEIRDFFRFSGEYIQDVKYELMGGKRITEFIRLFCNNLKRITFRHIKLKPDTLKKSLQLIELRLLVCYFKDTAVKSLLHLNNLDTLIIYGNTEVTGKFLSGLSQLKKLSLYFCVNIETKNLIKICEAMKNLKSLDVRGCERLTSDFFETMADHCLELEVLKMSCSDFSFDCVARLPCLKHLELSDIATFNSTLLTTLLIELVAHKADQLESLKCFGSLTVDHFTAISELKQLKIFYCDTSMPIGDEALRKLSKLEILEELAIKRAYDITKELLLRLLQNCTRLHLLNIECCKEISTKFIAEAIDMLKSRRDESKKPFTIFARGTSIDELALAECPIYESAQKAGIIKVVFRPYVSYEY